MKYLLLTFFGILISLKIYCQSDTLLLINILPDQEIGPIAEFPGGMDSLEIYIVANNMWEVGSLTIEGKVIIQFNVETDGSITNVEILRGLYESCNREAIRIIKTMPKWTPARVDGKAIRSRMVVPISFNGLK